MGTNYYAEREVAFKQLERIHLGKSSAGWRFLLKAEPEWPRADSLSLWLKIVFDSRTVIKDEYGSVWPKNNFMEIVLHSLDGHDHLVYDPSFFGPSLAGPAVWNDYLKTHWTVAQRFDFTSGDFN